MTTVDRTIRCNLEAEEMVLGSALLSRPAVESLVADLNPEDFYRPAYAATFAAIVELHQEGMAVDTVTVSDVLRRQGQLDDLGGAATLVSIMGNVPSAASAGYYASIVRREASARRLTHACTEASTALYASGDPLEVANTLTSQIAALDSGGRLPERFWRTWAEYSVVEHQGVGEPLVPGVLNQHTRVIVLASEKGGKSMLLRQFAFCVAAGVHPFRFEAIEPVRVLVLDAENDDDELMPSSDAIRAVMQTVPIAQPIEPALFSAPYGMDLRSRRDRSELEAVLESFHPQLIIGGPVYKIMPTREGESIDTHAAAMHRILDGFRKRWGCAIMLEHHAPTGAPGKQREMRSKGGQQWAAWPEVTVALHRKTDNSEIRFDVQFPHPTRGQFVWPRRFLRGTRPGEWPWIPVLRASDAKSASRMTEPELPYDEEPF